MFTQRQKIFVVFLIYFSVLITAEDHGRNNTADKPQIKLRQSKLLRLPESGYANGNNGASDIGVVNEAITITSPPIAIQASQRNRLRNRREVEFPKPDRYGRCPPGYRKDKLPICREIW